MKRTTLMLDPDLVAEALRLTPGRSVSDLVRRALEAWVCRAKARQILEFRGSGIWEGSLPEMRGDRPRRPRSGGRRRS